MPWLCANLRAVPPGISCGEDVSGSVKVTDKTRVGKAMARSRNIHKGSCKAVMQLLDA